MAIRRLLCAEASFMEASLTVHDRAAAPRRQVPFHKPFRAAWSPAQTCRAKPAASWVFGSDPTGCDIFDQ
jgi:hypothetical protein